jgi:hypothetical protein
MSQIEKLLIPLIDENLSYSDICDDSFIGVFTEDINMPGLNYIYLVYMYDMNNLHLKLCENGIDIVRRIGDDLYHIIKFPIYLTDLKRIIKGEYNLISNEGISKIYTFWKDFDLETANFPFYKTLIRKPEGFTVPQ